MEIKKYFPNQKSAQLEADKWSKEGSSYVANVFPPNSVGNLKSFAKNWLVVIKTKE